MCGCQVCHWGQIIVETKNRSTPPAYRRDHSFIDKFTDIFRDRLRSYSHLFSDLLLPYGRLVLGNLHENLEARDFTFAA